jgi:hypothetical protein
LPIQSLKSQHSYAAAQPSAVNRQICPRNRSSHQHRMDGQPPYCARSLSAQARPEALTYARWLSDVQLADACLALPIGPQQADRLRDYRDLLHIALRPYDRDREKALSRSVAQRFLMLISESEKPEMPESLWDVTATDPSAENFCKFINVARLFESVRPARSLAEALAFRIVRT